MSTLQSSRQLGFSTGGDQEAGGDTRESESDDDDGQPDAASIARQVRVWTLSALCDPWTFGNTLRISCFTSVGMLSDSCACLTLQGCARREMPFHLASTDVVECFWLLRFWWSFISTSYPVSLAERDRPASIVRAILFPGVLRQARRDQVRNTKARQAFDHASSKA